MPSPISGPPRVVVALVAAFLAVLACRDEGPRKATSARLEGPGTVHLFAGQDVALEMRCLDSDGRDLPTKPVRWISSLPQIADVRPSGRFAQVRAMHVGTTKVFGVCRKQPLASWEADPYILIAGAPYVEVRIEVDAAPATSWEIDLEGDTIDLRVPTALDSTTGVHRLLTVRGRTATGEILAQDRFTWTSEAPEIATITPAGLLTAVTEGISRLTLAGLGAERAVFARVSADAPAVAWDVALTDAHWTQGVQDERQSIPVVREGRAAVVNVLAYASEDAPPSAVILWVFNTAGGVIWRDSVTLTPAVGAPPSFATPNAQFLVPRTVVNAGASWRLERVASATGADALPANDRLPRSGNEPLRAVTPPVLKLHLVPLKLTKHGNVSTPVDLSTAVFYDSIARIRLPLGRVEISVGAPQPTNANFLTEDGSTTSGDTPFFMRVLEEIDAARVAHPTLSTAIWIGVIPRPGFETSRWGGMAYYPSTPTLSGPFSKSQVVKGHDWYESPVSAGFTVAHELGHNFGRRHAPCGGVANADPYYPVPGGRAGRWLHWTSRWEHGAVNFASTISDTASDIMSYCGDRWVSAYTYLGILNFRQLDGAALVAAEERGRSIIVRGVVLDGVIRLSPPRVEEAVVVAEAPGSPVLVELLDAAGQVLFQQRARVGRTGDPEAGLAYVAHIALRDEWSSRVRRVRASAFGRTAEQALSIP